MQAIRHAPGLKAKESKTLRHEVSLHLTQWPEDAGEQTITMLRDELAAGTGLAKLAIARMFQEKLGRPIDVSDFEFSVDLQDPQEVSTETDAANRFGLSPEEVNGVVLRGLLAVAGLCQRFETMKLFSALTGFRDGEEILFERRLDFLAKEFLEESRVSGFRRVLEVAGLPTLQGPWEWVGPVSVERLLDVRASRECREFRDWLETVDSFSDEELRDLLEPLRSRIGNLLGAPASRGLRFLATGALSHVNPPAGFVAGAVDQFLLDRVFPTSGPATFLDRSFRSIFEVPPSVSGTT